MRSFLPLVLLPLLLIAVLTPVAAQPETPVNFALSDIHRSQPGLREAPLYLHANRLELHGVTMMRLIETAWPVNSERIFGGPNWLDTDQFDVIAPAGTPVTASNFQPMLQQLLADRFHLKVSHQDRPEPVYALLAMPHVLLTASASGEPGCKSANQDGYITVACQKFTMDALAGPLSQFAPNYFNHPVVDRTGLTGSYDFTLKWTGRARLGMGDAEHPDVSLFGYMEKELGIKVEAQTRPAGALVIESVDHDPTPNAPDAAEKLQPLVTEFDVAEIHLSKPGTEEKFEMKNGRIEAFGVTMKEMIGFAYNLDDYMLPPGEKWLDSDRFDAVAKTDKDTPDGALQAMLQNLLATRFHFRSHFSQASLPVWALTAPKGKGKLRPAAGSDRGGCTRTPKDGAMSWACRNMTMAQFAARLPNVGGAVGYLTDFPMVDLTKLSGAYDFDLNWAPPARVYGNGGRGAGSGSATAAPTAANPDGGLTIFEAIDKQMELKLAVQKYPMPVLVIDHIDRPEAQ